MPRDVRLTRKEATREKPRSSLASALVLSFSGGTIESAILRAAAHENENSEQPGIIPEIKTPGTLKRVMINIHGRAEGQGEQGPYQGASPGPGYTVSITKHCHGIYNNLFCEKIKV